MKRRFNAVYAVAIVQRLMKWVALDITVLALLLCGGDASPNVTSRAQPTAEPHLTPFFVFGDSLVDVGNNKFVPYSPVRVDYLPNGIDFVDGPTGRFCNGRTVVDVFCDIIGAPYPPAYLDPTTTTLDIILKGANYASGAAGILETSGSYLGPHLTMETQIECFNNTVARLNSRLGSANASKFLANVIGLIVIGSNDFINNYWLPLTPFSYTRLQYTPQQFNAMLLNKFDDQVTAMYNLGLRKMVVAGVGPLGNIPVATVQAGSTFIADFVDKVNDHVKDFNNGLTEELLPQLRRRLNGMTILYTDIFQLFTSILDNKTSFGFEVSNTSCCEGMACLPLNTFCPDRRSYVFWDAYHPTEAVNIIIANQIYNGGVDAISPINMKQLMASRP